jgi:hypothetical protein
MKNQACPPMIIKKGVIKFCIRVEIRVEDIPIACKNVYSIGDVTTKTCYYKVYRLTERCKQINC